MTFASATKSVETTATTSHSVTLPASIASGDFLAVIFCIDDTGDELDPPTGWTERATGAAFGSSVYIWTKTAGGSEGTSLSVTTSSDVKSAHRAVRFQDVDWGGISAEGTGASTSMAYGALTDPGVTAEYVACGLFESNPTVSAYPSDFPNGQDAQALFGCNVTAAVSNSTGTLPTNKTFTLSSSTNWSSFGFYVTPSSGTTHPLGKGTVTVTGYDLTSSQTVHMLGKGGVLVTGYPLSSPLLAKGTVTVTGYRLIMDPIRLDKGTVTVAGRTHFGARRMTRNEVTTVDWSSATAPLCLLPPKNLVRSDSFGALLSTDVASGMDVTFDAESYTLASGITISDHVLRNQGDFILFRYDGTRIVIVGKWPIGSELFTVSNYTERLTFDANTPTLSEVSDTLATVIKKLGLSE